MYQFEFEISEEEYFDFNLFNLYHIPQNRDRLTINRLVFPLLLMVIALSIGYITKNYAYYCIAIGIYIVIWELTFDRRIRHSVKRNITKMKTVGKMPYANRRMAKFEEEHFISADNDATVQSSYEAIEKLCRGKSAFYLYKDALSAYILPYRIFKDDAEKEAFYQFIKVKALHAIEYGKGK